MDSFKKHVFADQILSSRRKLLTRFSYGVGACFLILTGLFLCNSSKSPFSSSSLFQGFYSSHLNPSTGSWRFSFPTSSFSSSTNTKQPQITQGVNFSANAQIGEETTSDNAKVPSFGVKQDGISDQTSIRANGSKNETLPVSDLGLDLLQKTHVGDSTQINSSKSFADNPANNGSRTDFYGSLEDCDVYNGRWVKVDDDDTMPYYPPGSCPYIDKDFDCHLNGRPDDAYLKWRWQPSGCNIPRLNATDFLEKLRGKKLVFVGDSINRNMWESLVCILRHSVKDKKRVYEISGRTEFKKKGFYAFRFEDYNCTVDFVGSPFLVRESIFKGKNRTFETLRLDLMDKTTSMYEDADILIFNTGHWWTHDKTKLGEDYYQEGNHVHGRLKVLEAYKRALTTWSKWVDQKINSRRQTHVIFRGYSATHFRGGPWNSGGQCHKETEPFNNTKYLAKYPSKMRALETVMKQMKTPVIYMNISRLTDFRKDSHPSVYRTVYRTEEEKAESVKHQDCSHWCLPGVPDVWNQLLYVSLLKAGFGSW